MTWNEEERTINIDRDKLSQIAPTDYTLQIELKDNKEATSKYDIKINVLNDEYEEEPEPESKYNFTFQFNFNETKEIVKKKPI